MDQKLAERENRVYNLRVSLLHDKWLTMGVPQGCVSGLSILYYIH